MSLFWRISEFHTNWYKMRYMRRATITIPEELERALEPCQRDLEVPSPLAAIVQTVLRGYLSDRGYLADTDTDLEDELILSSTAKPEPLVGAPEPGNRKTVADAVVEDRR